MNYKYVILDFGKVLAGPTTGEWFIPPKFKELVDMSLIDMEKLNQSFDKHDDIISRKMNTEEEEYHNFYELYSLVLQEVYPKYTDDIAHSIAYNFTYKQDKYTFYDNVKEDLERLSKKYKLLLLTDNWPCIERILKENKLYKYFDKIYISSEYGSIKAEGIFFDYLLNDYNMQKGEALFIDDSIINLDVAVEKGLDVLLMDRDNNNKCNKYKKINDLNNI